MRNKKEENDMMVLHNFVKTLRNKMDENPEEWYPNCAIRCINSYQYIVGEIRIDIEIIEASDLVKIDIAKFVDVDYQNRCHIEVYDKNNPDVMTLYDWMKSAERRDRENDARFRANCIFA